MHSNLCIRDIYYLSNFSLFKQQSLLSIYFYFVNVFLLGVLWYGEVHCPFTLHHIQVLFRIVTGVSPKKLHIGALE